jgi:hypothetical protein
MKFNFTEFSYSLIEKEFNNLLEATINKIEREWPEKWETYQGAKFLLVSTMHITRNIYKSILFLCVDKKGNPNQKIENFLSVPPLARTLADSIFNLVFLFHDLPNRSNWYFKSGYREFKEEYNRYLNRYCNDPEWKNFFDKYNEFISQIEPIFEITSTEKENPGMIYWWPNPGKMPKHQNLSKDRQDFLTYLNLWFYKNLSSQSHLSLPGFYRMFFLETENDDDNLKLIKKKSDFMLISILLTLTIMSEIELECHFGLGNRLSYIWCILNEYFGYSKELYNYRYRDKLPNL